MRQQPLDAGLSVTDLQAVLALGDDKAIAAALRLIEIQLRAGGLPDNAQTARRLHLEGKEWRAIRAILLELFTIRDGIWTHPGLATRLANRREQQRARSERAKTGWARRKAGDAPAAQVAHGRPQGQEKTAQAKARNGAAGTPRAGTAPAKASPQGVNRNQGRTSGATNVFEQGAQLLMYAGYSERDARHQIGYFRKHFNDDVVLAAINETAKKEPSAPFPYMRKVAQNLWEDRKSGQRQEKPRPIATPETMGLSPGLTRKIQDNARRKPHFTFSKKANDQDDKLNN